MAKDYYIVLGVSRGADTDKIKKAYRRVAKKYHPDVAHSKESPEKFREIREAYETVSFFPFLNSYSNLSAFL
jgi:molecular chaperone DnaJ